MHCFIGIDVQPPISQEIIGLQKRWTELDLPSADFHKHTDPHITLVPPFECNNVADLSRDLEKIGQSFPQFSLFFAHVAAFNHRILHVSLESNAIVELRARLLAACAGFTQVHDSNPFFHPHTTIAYAKLPMTTREQTLASQILEQALKLPQRQEVTNILLYGREKAGINYGVITTIDLSTTVDIEQ